MTLPPAGCAQALVPFERTVPLEVHARPQRQYRIEAHGASATFTLERDKLLNPR